MAFSRAMGSWSQRLPQRAALEQKTCCTQRVCPCANGDDPCTTLWLDPFSCHFWNRFRPLFGATVGKHKGSATLESVCGACMHAVRTDVWLHRALRSNIARRGRWAPPCLRAIQLEILICLWGHFEVHFSFTLGFTLVEAH